MKLMVQCPGADLGLGKGGFFFVRSNYAYFKPHPLLLIHCIETQIMLCRA